MWSPSCKPSAVVCIAVPTRKCNKVCWFMHRRFKIVNWNPFIGEAWKTMPATQQAQRKEASFSHEGDGCRCDYLLCSADSIPFPYPMQNVVMSNAWRPCGSEMPLNERAWKKKLIWYIQIKHLFLAKRQHWSVAGSSVRCFSLSFCNASCGTVQQMKISVQHGLTLLSQIRVSHGRNTNSVWID